MPNRSRDAPLDENAFLWLATQFGHENIATKPMLPPTPEHFPIRYDGSKESLIKTAEIVARQTGCSNNFLRPSKEEKPN